MKRHLAIILAGLTAFLILPSSLLAQDKVHREPRQARVKADGVRLISISAGPGKLVVKGDPQLTEVQVDGTACAKKASDLASVKLTASRSGGTIRINCIAPDNRKAWFDVTIMVPARARLAIEDGAGSISVVGVASAEIQDSSGSMTIKDIRGDLRIRDGSGSISSANIGGEILIHDGSGSITVQRAGGVTIKEDGSGSMSFVGVRGNVLVEKDGSGSITAKDVGGDFTVLKKGGGSINHKDVKGKVRTPARRKNRRTRI